MSFDHAFNHDLPLTPRGILSAVQHDLFYHMLHRKSHDLVELGDRKLGCNWTIRSADLGPDSVIYSAGVGRDITFEHGLANLFGAKVILLDPSPTGLETMKIQENRRHEFIFINAALAGHDGELSLAPPPDPEEGSWISDIRGSNDSAAGGIKVPCRCISSLMEEFGHSHVDLLKIDIEGAEFPVIESILNSHVKIHQIAVEYHNGVIPGISKSSTIRSLLNLYRKGYRIVHKGGSNHTLYLASEF